MNQTQPIKAIFFDIDGTLLSGATHTIPQSAQEALHRAHDSGYRLFMSTGRHPDEIAQVPELAHLPFDGTVAMNGQYCTCKDTVVHMKTLPQQDVALLAEHLRTAPYAGLYCRQDGLYLTEMTDIVQQICESIGTEASPVGGIDHMLAQPILQAGLFLGPHPVPEDLFAQMTGCYYTRWHMAGIDIAPLGGGKWTGVQKMAAHFGIAPGEIMAVGDNDNDVDMLRAAAFSVAMGNGTDEAKRAAHHVTAHIDEHGIAKALALLPGLS